MYVHVKVGLGKVERVLEKVRKKLKKVWKKVEKKLGKNFRKSYKKLKTVRKIIHKNVTSCPSRREKIKNFGTFPREQRPERGLRLPRVFLNSHQLLTNGPTPHRDSIHRQPSRRQMVRMVPRVGTRPRLHIQG